MRILGALLILIGFLMVMTGGSMLDSASLNIPAAICVIGAIFFWAGAKMINKSGGLK